MIPFELTGKNIVGCRQRDEFTFVFKEATFQKVLAATQDESIIVPLQCALGALKELDLQELTETRPFIIDLVIAMNPFDGHI